MSNATNEELEYEIVKWDPDGQSSFWLKLPKLNGGTSIKALWGNQNALVQPGYSKDGRIWSKFRGVWHMDGTADDLVKESSSSFHAIPYNFETLRAPGVIGTALSFDGVNDYLDMPLDSHPPADARQVTFSFWSYGGTRHLNNNSILESGSSLGRHLNIHLPWSNARVYWDAGVGGIDRIEKDDPVYSGRWTYWAFQKDRTPEPCISTGTAFFGSPGSQGPGPSVLRSTVSGSVRPGMAEIIGMACWMNFGSVQESSRRIGFSHPF